MSPTLSRSHQTAAFIRLSAADSSNYRNRVNRFVESQNGNQIKVDFYTVNGDTGEVVPGVVFPETAPAAVSVPTDDDLLALAEASGYQLSTVLHNTKS